MKCRVCGCTEQRACDGGCSWVNGADICSICAAAVEALRNWLERSNRPSWSALKREMRPLRTRCVGGEPE
jgi:hypothetical protein